MLAIGYKHEWFQSFFRLTMLAILEEKCLRDCLILWKNEDHHIKLTQKDPKKKMKKMLTHFQKWNVMLEKRADKACSFQF